VPEGGFSDFKPLRTRIPSVTAVVPLCRTGGVLNEMAGGVAYAIEHTRSPV